MNAIRITWPTGHTEARADYRSNEGKAQARTMKQLVCKKAK